MRPTAMLFRNLASMDVEESIRANPIDGVVLLCGCDKTTPSLVMGAASCDLPALVVSGGPMLNGKYPRPATSARAPTSGASAKRCKAGTMSLKEFSEAEVLHVAIGRPLQRHGHGVDDGSMVEALGLGLPHNAAIPAVDSRRYALAHVAGRRIVQMVDEDLRISQILTREAFENADSRERRARRIDQRGHSPAGDRRPRRRSSSRCTTGTRSGANVPTLVDLKPSGRFLMEDFYYAGGLPAVMRALAEHGLLHRDAITVNGKTMWENVQDAPNWNTEVIRPFDKPVVAQRRHRGAARQPRADGAVLKPSAASPAADEASRPRRRVREHRALQGAHRRSRRSMSTPTACWC